MGRGILFTSAEKERKEKETKGGVGGKKRNPHAFRGLNDGESDQALKTNSNTQKLTASFSVNVHLLEPAVWGLVKAGQTEASEIQIF